MRGRRLTREDVRLCVCCRRTDAFGDFARIDAPPATVAARRGARIVRACRTMAPNTSAGSARLPHPPPCARRYQRHHPEETILYAGSGNHSFPRWSIPASDTSGCLNSDRASRDDLRTEMRFLRAVCSAVVLSVTLARTERWPMLPAPGALEFPALVLAEVLMSGRRSGRDAA